MDVAAAFEQGIVPIEAEHGFHDRTGVFECFDGFKQRHDIDAAVRFAVFHRQQAAFFQQQCQGEQVAGLFAVGNNALCYGIFAKFVFDFARFVENCQFVAGMVAVCDERAVQRTLMAQFSQQDGLFLFFVQAVVVFQACVLEKLGNHIGVFACVLAQVERHHVEAEHGHGTDEVCQTAFGKQAAAVVDKGTLQFFQIIEKFLCRSIRLEKAEFAAHAQTERARFAHSARHDVSNGAAVGFFRAGKFFVRREGCQCHYVVVDFDAADGERQFAVKFVEFATVKTEHGIGVAAEAQNARFRQKRTDCRRGRHRSSRRF